MNTDTKPTPETLIKWHDDPNNWKLGIFYFNREDKRLFPPKRLQGLGYTVNFANPWSLVAFVVLIAAAVALVEWLKR